jgi:hypothetical protein
VGRSNRGGEGIGMSERFAHVCQDGHQAIGHNDSESELCPLCRINSKEGELSALRSAIVEQTGLIKGLSERLGEIEKLHKADFNFRGVILDQLQYDAISNQLRPQRPAKRKKGRK